MKDPKEKEFKRLVGEMSFAEKKFKKLFNEMGLEEVFSGGRDEASMKVADQKIDEFCKRLTEIKPKQEGKGQDEKSDG